MDRPRIKDEILQKRGYSDEKRNLNNHNKKNRQQDFSRNTGYQTRGIEVQMIKGARVPGQTSKGKAIDSGNQGKENE